MNKRTTAAAIAAAGAVVALTALPASGHRAQVPGPIVLTGTQRSVDEKTIDLKPRGESVGDRMLSSETLRRDGKPVARVESECTLLDATLEGAQCSFTIMFHDGILIGQGASVSKPIPGLGTTDQRFAVLGGTGRYTGASGSVDVQPTRTGHRVTLQLAS
jgi:hypothetical protein